MDRIVDFIMDYIMPIIFAAFVVIVIAVLFFVLPMAIYDEMTSPTFSLRKDQWTCTSSHQETSTIYTHPYPNMPGVMMPITNASDVCDQWSRHP